MHTLTKSAATDCPGSCVGNDNGDLVTASQIFTKGSLTITVTASTLVWNDLNPNFAGLGVGQGSVNDPSAQ